VELIWLVPFFPLMGAVINGLFGQWFIRDRASWVAVPAAGLSCLVALLISVLVFAGGSREVTLYPWIVAGTFQVPVGFLVDPLSTVMMLTVTVVGFLVHVYSARYMHGDPGYARYFTYLNLFLFAMLVLVLADNYLLLFVGWEGVGLCSYLLIGFWYERKSAGDAANKAFIVNRVGDAGFLLGLFLIWTTFGSLAFGEIFPRAEQVLVPGSTLATVITLALFVGALGKSAQLPLCVWLPDAMEGPTPTSALIHAATMVTAGVYMVVRSSPLFSLAPDTSFLVAIVGALTAVFAASIGCVQTNIKQVIAYSTITQLGYMFLVAGLGAYATAMFHLFTHAFFKSLLFLGTGSVILALHGEHDIHRMGGLAPHMRVTAYAFLIGALASAGIFPLAGFWSQSQILSSAFNGGHYFVWGLSLVAAFLTAFYMFRLYLLTFGGRYRGDPRRLGFIRKVPAGMWIPLVILAVLTMAAGFVGVTPEHGIFHGLLGRDLPRGGGQAGVNLLRLPIALLPLGVACVGIGLAYLSYAQWWDLPGRLRTVYVVLFRRYFLDEIYYAVFLDGFRRLCRLLWTLDARVIDGAVNGAVSLVRLASTAASRWDETVIDGTVNGAAGLVLRAGAVSVQVDEKVVDGPINAVAPLALGIGTVAARVDERIVDGAVNTVADVVLDASTASARADRTLVDGAVNRLADLLLHAGEFLRRIQTGVIQNYILAMVLGIFVIAVLFLMSR
jgi:NADH-quinone oxidoreductase subunit L